MKTLIAILFFALLVTPAIGQDVIGCEHHIQPGDLDWCKLCGPCSEGEGDCDSDDECADGLVCLEVVGVDHCMYPENIFECPEGTRINIEVLTSNEIKITCK
jgi:hypothetical protein